MPKITEICVCCARVPLQNTTSFATRTVTARDYPLVKIVTDDGFKGIGFCYGGHKGGGLVTEAVRELLAPVLLGEDPYRVEGLWQEMYAETLLHGRVGSVMRALSALDVALWDRNARAADLPLYKYLGYCKRDTVPAYASGGYYLEGKTPDKLAEEVAAYVAAGFKAVKIKCGKLSPREEEHRVAAAREAIGPDVLLMLDFNNAWNDVPTALRTIRLLEPYDPYWVEEPFGPDDIESHARLAKETSIPIATGEIEAGRWRNLELLRKGGAEIIQTDPCVVGGITEMRRVADMAASFGVPLAPHWWHDINVHLVAAFEAGQIVEYFPDNQVLNFRDLIDRQLDICDGELVLPTEPGLGFNFVDDIVEKYAITPWETIKA